jgi:hypothetical protein
VSDLNNLGPAPDVFATPFTLGIYTFTTDNGILGYYAREGLNASPALGTTAEDLGWIRIEIPNSAQITKFGFFVGGNSGEHNHAAVAFFDTHNELLGSTGVSEVVGTGVHALQFVGFENTAGLIGSVLIQDADLNGTGIVVDNEIRDFVRRDLAASRHRLEDCSDLTPGNVDSLLQQLSGTTVQEIDHFIAELQALRQRLQHEATRVERKVVQYASLNEAARASMRTISENLSF